MKPILALSLALAVASCASQHPTRPSPDAQLDIYASVFQALIEHNASANMSHRKGIVLCLPGSMDPSPLFLQRFSATQVRVLPCSSYRKEGSNQEAVSVATGEPVIVFSVGATYLFSATQAYLDGAYFEANLSGAQYYFQLELRKGTWVVVEQKMTSIS